MKGCIAAEDEDDRKVTSLARRNTWEKTEVEVKKADYW